ncbi:lipopolysaccharide assembly protein LapA domain-containing protein [Halomonas sp. HMF6819]|uniref:lipopolysaccharide assembly protein LapA domain-containing protein n=1 Tax=Halomonas sp. HMF6819 TaxID=3373085 RepID=UPI00379ED4CD
MRWIKGLLLAIVLLVVLLVGILFAVNNQQAIALNLIWTELPPISLSVWLLATLTLGVILGMLAMLGVYIRLKARLARSERHSKHQQKELDRLRTQEFKELA